MILRFAGESSIVESPVPGAAELFLESQKHPEKATGMVTQLAHSELAGELARQLLAEPFGLLPPELVEAAEDHDRGWAESDCRQLAHLADGTPGSPAGDSCRWSEWPKPFPAMHEDELEAWRGSVALARADSDSDSKTGSPLVWCLIGRHFTALARRPTPSHLAFIELETPSRLEAERRRGYDPMDLERWTGVVGFCDLLSLYLCSGLRGTVTFPLTHPAYRHAAQARHVTLSWRGGCAVFSEPIFRPGSVAHIRTMSFGGTDEWLMERLV
jgi:Protein of unknown function (DUF3891)